MITLVLSVLTLVADTTGGSAVRVDTLGDPLPPGAVARLGSLRWRTPAPLLGLWFTPDGQRLIGRTADSEFVVWSHPTGSRVCSFRLPLAPSLDGEEPAEPTHLDPNQLRFSANGRHALIHFGWDRLYRVELATGRVSLTSEGDRMLAHGTSADGRRRLVSSHEWWTGGSGWSQLCVCDSASPGKRVALAALPVSVPGPPAGCLNVGSQYAARPCLSPDGRFAAAGFIVREPAVSRPRTGFAAWDLHTGQSWTVSDCPAGVLQFAPDGRTVLAADERQLALWRFVPTWSGRSSLRQVARIPLGELGIDPSLAQLSPDGRQIVAVDYGGRALVFDTADPQHCYSIRLPESMATCLAVSPDGGTLAVALPEVPRVAFVDLHRRRPIERTAGHTSAVRLLRCDPSGRALLSKSANGTLRVWDLLPRRNGAPAAREMGRLTVDPEAYGFLLTPGGRTVFFRKGDGEVWRWRVGTCAATVLFRQSDPIEDVWLSADGAEILIDDANDRLRRWTADGAPKELPSFATDGPIERVDYVPGGREVAVRLRGAWARFDRATGERLPVRPGPPAVVDRYSVNCNRREFRVEIGDEVTQKLRYIHEPTPEEDTAESTSPGTVGSVSADARLMAYVAGQRAVVRDFDSGEQLACFERPDCPTTEAALSPDGNFLIAGYRDGQILIWDLRPRPAESSDAEHLWAGLAADAASARRAAARLLLDAHSAIAVLGDRVRPRPEPTEDEFCQWAADLDHPRYAERERSTRLLVRYYPAAKKILEMAAREEISAELRERLARVERLAERSECDPGTLRLLRAIAVLERIPGECATELLQRLAAGHDLPAVRAGDALARRAFYRHRDPQ